MGYSFTSAPWNSKSVVFHVLILLAFFSIFYHAFYIGNKNFYQKTFVILQLLLILKVSFSKLDYYSCLLL